jgi:hypothetical protein
MLKHLAFIFALAILAIGCKKGKQFKIDVSISNSTNDFSVYLARLPYGESPKIIDSIKNTNKTSMQLGDFAFDPNNLYGLILENSQGRRATYNLISDNKKIGITLNFEKISDPVFENSIASQSLFYLLGKNEEFVQKGAIIKNETTRATDNATRLKWQTLADSNLTEQLQFLRPIALNAENPTLSFMVLNLLSTYYQRDSMLLYADHISRRFPNYEPVKTLIKNFNTKAN